MRDRSIIPTNLMDWPRVAGQLPEVKLILGLGFWGGRYTNSIGVAEIPLRPLAASLGLDPSALHSGINTLCNEGLLAGDFERSEFFIKDWYRFHTFRGVGLLIAKSEFAKIASNTVKQVVSSAAPWLSEGGDSSQKQEHKSPTAAATAKQIASATEKIRVRRVSGIVTFIQGDPERAAEIESRYSVEQISSAVTAIESENKEPVPGLVQKIIERMAKKDAEKKLQLKNKQDGSPPLQREQREKVLPKIWAAVGKESPR